ncbi:MAG: hypothetical protein SCK28_09515, partial [Bacillota bacterium]|nr:hypothetical protein [Bacillota bacterium]
MQKKVIIGIAVMVLLMLAVGCGSNITKDELGLEVGEEAELIVDEETEKISEEAEQANFQDNETNLMAEEELAKLGVNELGQVMVLMYHVIGDKEAEWARTRENFRSDLLRLYELGYRSVKMSDFLKGEIATAPGTTPVILTFDDGTPGHFRFIETDDGLEVDPDSAVGILL